MSKKQKRNVSHGTPSVKKATAAPAEISASVASSAKPTSTSTAAVAGSTNRIRLGRFAAVQEFNPDYSYIKSDLKRIGILAASFFSILIILSFILK